MLADSGAAAFRLLSPGRGATATGVAFAGAPFFPRNRCGERAIWLRCRMLACGSDTGRRVFMADRLAVAFSLVSKGKQIGCCRVTELWTLHLDSCTVQNVHSAHFICTMHSPTGSPSTVCLFDDVIRSLPCTIDDAGVNTPHPPCETGRRGWGCRPPWGDVTAEYRSWCLARERERERGSVAWTWTRCWRL